jgi:hypothetical protein
MSNPTYYPAAMGNQRSFIMSTMICFNAVELFRIKDDEEGHVLFAHVELTGL